MITIIIMILLLLLVLIYFFTTFTTFTIKEKFLTCNKMPSGPYESKCTNIKYDSNSNILYAYCPKSEPQNSFDFSQLDLSNCSNDSNDSNDCGGINVNSNGNLICE